MKFAHRITWSIGLNRGGVPYPPSEAIDAVQRQLAARGIDGFTVTPGVGYWQGDREDCLTIVVLVDWDDFGSRAVADGIAHDLADGIAHDLAADLGQDAVAWAVDTLNGGGLAFR
jgi:hypothetical protein